MIVPQFWAEARLQQPPGKTKRQVTVRRFGWSDVSQVDAERAAHERAQAALARAVSGEKIPRYEPKRGYNGAEGIPIREEILRRHGDVVITRNSFGAQCLNTPDVLFADIDFAHAPTGRSVALHAVLLLIGAAAFAAWLHSGLALFAGAFAVLILTYPLAALTHRIHILLQGGAEKAAFANVRNFMQRNPEWLVRLYRTPAGLRVLVMHATFSAQSATVAEFFKAVGVDPLYQKMCRHQDCFRARVSPKPWRIGIKIHLKPRPGIWPVHPDRLHLRQQWVHTYEQAAADYASCHFIESLGCGPVDAKAEAVRRLHDQLSRAESSLRVA